MSSTTEFDQTVWYYWQGVVHWTLCFIITFILTASHAVFMYQDLRTIERKSLSHRASKPQISKSYTGVLAAVFISFLSYNTLSLLAVFHFFVIDFIDGSTKCALLATANAIAYQIAKGSMYIVFLGRIHTVYSPSSYGYKPIFIFLLSLVVIVITAMIFVLEISFNEHHYKIYPFGSYAMHCNVNYANFVVMIVASFDFIMCLFSAFAFIKPLIKVYQSRSHDSDVHNLMKLQKLIDVGQKYMIITCTAVLSTVLVMVWIGVTDTLLFVPYDVVINCVSMALMTPYYKDYHYQKLCCCCNKCVRLCCLLYKQDFDLKNNSKQQIVIGVPSKTRDSTINTGSAHSNKELHEKTRNSII